MQQIFQFSILSSQCNFNPTSRWNAVRTERWIVFLLRHAISTLILNLFRKFRLYLLPRWHHLEPRGFHLASPAERRETVVERSQPFNVFRLAEAEPYIVAAGTISQKCIDQFWSRWEAPPYGEIHWPPPCCTPTGQYLLD